VKKTIDQDADQAAAVAGAVAVVRRWQRRELTSRERNKELGAFLTRVQIYAVTPELTRHADAASLERLIRLALDLRPYPHRART
jgi:hypothetical protein